MNVVSLFSGVGGFDLGFEQAGFRTVYQCEWDKHATNILNRHWPDVPKWGDIQTLAGQEILRHCQTPDVIIWGSPCQDLSVAGKRAGLVGERSGLFHEGIRIINELREATDGRYPRVSVWENVAGALNSNRGADFGAVLDEMAAAGALVIEWALLDAQYFGVPQRRRRVFVVAVFDPATADRCPDPLLPVSESLPRHLAKGTKKGTGVAALTSNGVGTCGADDNQAQAGHLIGYRMRAFGEYEDDQTSSAIKARDYKDATDLVAEPVMTVRRLTPIECERLMGWPDNWTGGQADSHRYKQCGNGVATPVAQWIATHLHNLMENPQ